MKKIFPSILFSFLLTQASAQLVSVKKIKDIKPDDSYYEAVTNLVETFHVLGTEEVRMQYYYFPERPLTHRSFAIVMVNALDRIEAKFDHIKDQQQRDSALRLFTKKYLKGYSDSSVKELAGYAQYKDINNDDIDYASIKKLTNHYRLKLGGTNNTFSPEKPMTEIQIARIFTEYFGMRSGVKNNNAILNRGKWAIYLNTLLERLNDIATDMSND